MLTDIEKGLCECNGLWAMIPVTSTKICGILLLTS